MDGYIEREALLSEVDKAFKLFQDHDDIIRLYSDVRESVIYAPAAEVAPVVHGNYVTDEWGDSSCSVCGENYLNATQNYCPNCGARMDGDE